MQTTALNIDNPAHPSVPNQRSMGRARLEVICRDDQSHIGRLYQSGCAKIRVPQARGIGLEAILINSSGGMTGGDRLDWKFHVAADARATITTQACERIYKAPSDTARAKAAIEVGPGARLSWLPQETILFDRGSLTRSLDVELASSATALLVEPILIGRQAMGERVQQGFLRDRWRIRRDGELVHGEDLLLEGDIDTALNRRFSLSGHMAMVSLLLISPTAEAHLNDARQLIGPSGAVSAWNGKLLARLVTEDGYNLRKRLVPLIELLHFEASVPKVWAL